MPTPLRTLHANLDELAAQYCQATRRTLSETTVLELLEWAHRKLQSRRHGEIVRLVLARRKDREELPTVASLHARDDAAPEWRTATFEKFPEDQFEKLYQIVDELPLTFDMSDVSNPTPPGEPADSPVVLWATAENVGDDPVRLSCLRKDGGTGTILLAECLLTEAMLQSNECERLRLRIEITEQDTEAQMEALAGYQVGGPG